MGLMQSLRISASSLMAQRLRMDVISNNVANMNTTRTADGGPYRRQSVVFEEQGRDVKFRDFLQHASGDWKTGGGVQVDRILEDTTPPRKVHDPSHPDADADGFVLLPNIDIVTEMTDLVGANRAYEASVTVLNATKSLALSALRIGR
ncbi:MAG: flagellar basal body rod protein FlgC [Dehalococcoidia bacterium]